TESDGLVLFDPVANRLVPLPGLPPLENGGYTINCLQADARGNLWIGTWGQGLWQYRPQRQQTQYHLPGQVVRTLSLQDENVLWIGTYGEGMVRYDVVNQGWQSVELDAEVASTNSQKFIWTSLRDLDGNVWVGTFGKGLYRLNSLKNTFPYLPLFSPSGEPVSITTLEEVTPGTVWVGLRNHGLLVYDVATQTYAPLPLPIGQRIDILAQDAEGSVWIASEEGLFAVDAGGNILASYREMLGLPNQQLSNAITDILIDRQGHIWVSFTDGQVGRLGSPQSPEAGTFVSLAQILGSEQAVPSHERVVSLHEDNDGFIWIGRVDHTEVYNPYQNTLEIVPAGVITGLHQDREGNYWLPSNGGGLVKLNAKRELVARLGLDEGLRCLDLLTLETDDRGRVWMGSSCGISVLDTDTEIISHFDETYGLQLFSVGLQISTVLSDGTHLLGGNQGLIRFAAEDIRKEFRPVPLYLTDIRLNNESVAFENQFDSTAEVPGLLSEQDTLTLPDDQTVLTLDFSAYHHQVASDIFYSYRLEGWEDTWVLADAQHR
ncbi:MAG TPA: hypothetical protein DCP28_23525, partial [Cytophagales bacterium]|nr:hypothetical protein [Cytophagales bacterium]